jgi:hypothetical protein
MPDTRWETLEVQETFDLLASFEAGLTSAEAAKRLAEFGPNVLAAEEKIKILSIIIKTSGRIWAKCAGCRRENQDSLHHYTPV